MNIYVMESDTCAKYPNDVKWCSALSLKTLMLMIFCFIVIWFMIHGISKARYLFSKDQIKIHNHNKCDGKFLTLSNWFQRGQIKQQPLLNPFKM